MQLIKDLETELQGTSLEEDEVIALLHRHDTNGNGFLEMSEFLAALDEAENLEMEHNGVTQKDFIEKLKTFAKDSSHAGVSIAKFAGMYLLDFDLFSTLNLLY